VAFRNWEESWENTVKTSSNNSACPEREPALQAYLFEELEGEQRAELERHLEECAACRYALDEARWGISALAAVEEAPLPYGEAVPVSADTADADEAWAAFLKRVRLGDFDVVAGGVSRRGADEPAGRGALVAFAGGRRFVLGAVAAAMIMIGVGIGYFLLPFQLEGRMSTPSDIILEAARIGVEQGAVDALARAEFLADLGVGYVDGVLQLVASVMDLDLEAVVSGKAETVRAGARQLLRDGRLLRRYLEPERDRAFLATIGRAELFLEEVAALGGETGAPWSLGEIREILLMTRLGDRLVALDVNGAVTDALEASGWIGEEYIQSREVRK